MSAVATQYLCYQCNRTVSLSSPSTDPLCPICHSGFLEEYENTPTPNPNFDPFTHIFSSSPDLSALFGPATASAPDEFNPFSFLQNYLTTLRNGGGQIQLVIENGQGRAAPNLGDYFVGPGLEQLIQQLAENDPNRYGTPPASKSAIDALPNIKIDCKMMESDYSQCAVCMDDFGMDEMARQMPCKHMYHEGCIMPWLELHNSCPVCRFELPTDDADYESSRGREEDGNDGAGGERRFRVTLPWPFRGFGGEGSNSGGQAREEDLD